MAELQLLVDDVVMKSFPLNKGTAVNHVPVERQQLHNFDYIRIAFTDFKPVADKKAKLAKTTVILPER